MKGASVVQTKDALRMFASNLDVVDICVCGHACLSFLSDQKCCDCTDYASSCRLGKLRMSYSAKGK